MRFGSRFFAILRPRLGSVSQTFSVQLAVAVRKIQHQGLNKFEIFDKCIDGVSCPRRSPNTQPAGIGILDSGRIKI